MIEKIRITVFGRDDEGREHHVAQEISPEAIEMYKYGDLLNYVYGALRQELESHMNRYRRIMRHVNQR